MKSSFFKIGLFVTLVMVVPMISHGASGSVSSSWVAVTAQEDSTLLLSAITAQDNMHILVSFNQSVVPEAVRVRIAKQSDGSTIRVDEVTGVRNTPKNVLVALSDTLTEWATYTLTVVSAISESGVVIKEWSDALKEFTAPTPLKSSIVVFNAPSNPNAVVATGASMVPSTSSSWATGTGTKVTTPSKAATELPLTGMNPLLFLIIAGGLAFVLLFRRKA